MEIKDALCEGLSGMLGLIFSGQLYLTLFVKLMRQLDFTLYPDLLEFKNDLA